MRQTHQCPKCQGAEIFYIPALRDNQDRLAIHVEQGWVEKTIHGALEAYVCGACGFTELYAVDAARIPIEQIPGARRLGPVPKPPYR